MELESFVLALDQEVADYHTPVVDLVAVETRDPFRILVTTILSARTRDEITSRVARRLFREAPDVHSLGRLSEERILRGL